MNPKALKSLEYYKIIDQLTENASSQMGKDLCRHLLPSEDVYEIRHMQTQTRDALTRLLRFQRRCFPTDVCSSDLEPPVLLFNVLVVIPDAILQCIFTAARRNVPAS